MGAPRPAGMEGIGAAIDSLRRGEFVLVHDSAGRENEVDMVVAAAAAAPEHIARMRQHAGGLICLAVGARFGRLLGLRYMHDMLAESLDAEAGAMVQGLAPYGDHPTFSISVNHYQTFTGVTDRDRALTVRELAALHALPDPRRRFVSSFKAPGHVPLLLASEGMLSRRRGHTEMSAYLAEAAGMAPAAAICEMMDAQTYAAMSVKRAAEYARHNGIPLVDGAEIVRSAARVHRA